jgi:hypothetical protein
LPPLVLALSSPCALPYQISWIFATLVNFYQRSSRRESVSLHDTDSLDIIFSYFPVNILLQTKENFEKLSNYNIYNSYKEKGEDIIYRSPSIYLAGGIFLTRQPKGIYLITDLVMYLQKIMLILNHIKPDWDDIDTGIARVLNSQKIKQKKNWLKTLLKLVRLLPEKASYTQTASLNPIPYFKDLVRSVKIWRDISSMEMIARV